ncbi:MAG: hypothetical protein ACHQET_03645 [Chitinophagales bacterium]
MEETEIKQTPAIEIEQTPIMPKQVYQDRQSWYELDLYSNDILDEEKKNSDLQILAKNLSNHLKDELKKVDAESSHNYLLNVTLYESQIHPKIFKLVADYITFPHKLREILSSSTIQGYHLGYNADANTKPPPKNGPGPGPGILFSGVRFLRYNQFAIQSSSSLVSSY